MSKLIKTFITATALATVLIGSITAAEAARVVPPPARDPGAVVQNGSSCFTPNQAAARMAGNVKDAGYLDTFRYTYFKNNTRVQAFGVKANEQWYAFVVELCKGSIIEEGKLKYGRPF